jgi:hypothetical protein
MAISARDRGLLRELAKRVAEIAARPEEAEKARLWRVCNDLRPERAMVFANPQNGWPELHAKWLTLRCEDELARGFEWPLRLKLLRTEHIPDDFPLLPTFDVDLPVHGAGYEDYGLRMEVTRTAGEGGAYHIVPDIKDERDLKRLHYRPIEIDHAAADRRLELTQDLLGDLLQVRKLGKNLWRYGLSRVLVHMRGLDQMMLDMYDNPGLLHRLMSFLRDDFAREIDLFAEAGAISLNNGPDNVTGSGGLTPTDDLPAADYAGLPRTKDSICWAESQETVGVGPGQFEEFVLQYQLPLMARFGLVDYGCCEPLDRKVDLLIARVPHLRWVAVVPWGNRELMAEKLGTRYVYVYKPNPSLICQPRPAWDAAAQEVRETLAITKRHGCPTHLVMKDTSTFCGEPERLTQWARMAVELARELA